MSLPAWDPASVEGGDPYAVRGKRHGNYCGWGHSSPPGTAPVDAIDAICRQHDMAYEDGTSRSQRCAADTYAREQLAAWLARWGSSAPPRMVEKAEAMRRALWWAEAASGCLGLLGGETNSSGRPAYEPHEAEQGDVYSPLEGPQQPSGAGAASPAAGLPPAAHPAGGAAVLPPSCWDALADRCEDDEARSELETLETAEAFMAGV